MTGATAGPGDAAGPIGTAGEGVVRSDGALETDDGLRLPCTRWLPPEGRPVRARMVVIHGMGEHAGRYDEFARRMAGRGVSVLSWDQRGHGRSPGPRGAVASLEELVSDVGAALDAARVLPGAGEPFLFGHSMGGLISLRWLQTRGPRLSGAVISAPWLGTAATVPAWKTFAARLLGRLAPRFALSAGVDPEVLTRDPVKRREYDEDPLVHDRVSAGLYRTALVAQGRALEEPLPDVPLLLLVPLEDRLTDPSLTRRWGEAMEGPVTVELLDGYRHEALNDLGREAVYRTVADWVLERSEPVPSDRVSS